MTMSRAEAASLLGVPTDATHEAVRVAYRRSASMVHPDTTGRTSERANATATRLMARLNEARDVLLRWTPSESTVLPPSGDVTLHPERAPQLGHPAPPTDPLRGPRRRRRRSGIVLAVVLAALIASAFDWAFLPTMIVILVAFKMGRAVAHGSER